MKRFLWEFLVSSSYSLPFQYKDDFNPLLMSLDPVLQGSLRATVLQQNPNVPIQLETVEDWTVTSDTHVPSRYVRAAFDQDHISQLENLYSFLYSSLPLSDLTLNTVVCKYSKIEYHGTCLLYTSPSPRDATLSRMPSSA